MVLGYSFPAEDAYGRFLFREAVRRRPENLTPPKIRYYDLPEYRYLVEKAFREVFSEMVDCRYMGKVKTAEQFASEPDC